MQFPDFFASAPVIRMHDPLAEFLGAAQDGIIEYRYAQKRDQTPICALANLPARLHVA